MAVLVINLTLVFFIGVLGNLVSLMVLLSPLPTFYQIYKKKSTEGFQSIPYVIALFNCMLWVYYALHKQDGVMLLTVNSIGCIIELFYIAAYLVYAPTKAKVVTVKLLLLLNLGGFALIVLVTHFVVDGPKRIEILGWLCVSITISVFAAPLCVMRKVIQTKSIEFMPFILSFSLTLAGVVWFFYGLLVKDICIALPNVLGFAFGVLQMVLYAVYRNRTARVEQISQVPEHIIEVVKLNTPECKAIDLPAPELKKLDEDSKSEAAEESQRVTKVVVPTES